MKVSLSNHFNTLFAETDLDFADCMDAATAKTNGSEGIDWVEISF